MGTSAPLAHIRPLDGVRALACLLVVAGHFGYAGFGGWVGVQIFFVLSGFLITRILVAAKGRDAGGYFGTFYRRRSLRIFPVYFLLIGVLAAASALTGWPEVSHREWAYLVTYTANFAALDPAVSTFSVFGHVWSLSVEEQFYLVWPLVVFLLSASSLRRLCLALVVGVPIVRLVVTLALGGDHMAAYVTYELTPCQLDAFAWGALLVVGDWSWLRRPRLAFRWLACVVLVAGIVNAAVLVRAHLMTRAVAVWTLGYPGILEWHYQYVWGYTAVDALACLLVLMCMRGEAWAWLSSAPMVRIGKVSYGIYLFHRPILMLVQRWFPYDVRQPRAIVIGAVFFAVVYVVAELSFQTFESWFLAMKDPQTRFYRRRPLR